MAVAAGFNLRKDPNVTQYKKVRVASQAYTIGDAVMLDRTSDAIDVVPATSSSTTLNIYGVAMETVTSSATSLLIALLTPEQEWSVQSANNSNTGHNYQRMLLTDANTVNNTGTDNTTKEAVFMQIGIIGAVADTHILGKFLKVANVTA